MNVVQGTAWYFPDTTGGIEVYIEGLVLALKKRGVESMVFAGRRSDQESAYELRGVPVYRYPVFGELNQKHFSGLVNHAGMEYFKEMLHKKNPDVYHQHTLSLENGLPHLRYAKSLHLPTVVSIHLPSPVCTRGTMMQWGNSVCDGVMDEVRCSACTIQSLGVPKWIASGIAQLPESVSRQIQNAPPNRLATVLGMKSTVRDAMTQIRELQFLADRIIIYSRWQQEVFERNGFPKEKLVLSVHGLNQFESSCSAETEKPKAGKFILGFMGRFEVVKGPDILFKALKLIPQSLPMELHLYGSIKGKGYWEKMKKAAEQDSRIKIKGLFEREKIKEVIRTLDCVVVPSQGFESGPLVVLEALQMKIPVIGSDLGGIRERIQHQKNGLLVPFNDVSAWARTITEMANPETRNRFIKNIGEVKTMDSVAQEIEAVYRQVL